MGKNSRFSCSKLLGTPPRTELAETISVQSPEFLTTELQRGTEELLSSRASAEQLCESLCLRGLKKVLQGFDAQELGFHDGSFLVLLHERN
jgi:hypothetical protein